MVGLRDKLDLRDKLESGVLVGDGTMDALLFDSDIEHPLDKAFLTHPQKVRDLHEEYLRAGARTIETNTNAASKIRPESSNLADGVYLMPQPRCHISRGT